VSSSNFPINRVVAFAGPYIAILSGALADWLIVHVHLLGLFHTTSTQVAGAITQIAVFGLTALLVWAGHHKWLTGWQNFEAVLTAERAKMPSFPPPVPAGSVVTTSGQLPSDAAPPITKVVTS
jgi:hypothetical protein